MCFFVFRILIDSRAQFRELGFRVRVLLFDALDLFLEPSKLPLHLPFLWPPAGYEQPPSMDAVTLETIPSSPVGTVGTGLTLRIINPFLVWAADQTVRHDDGLDLMLTYEIFDLLQYDCINPNV